MSKGADFSDLMPRILSAVVLVVLGLGCMWVGGDAFGVLLIVAAGLMAWETSRMHSDALIVHFCLWVGDCRRGFIGDVFKRVFGSGVLVAIAIGAAFMGHHTRAPCDLRDCGDHSGLYHVVFPAQSVRISAGRFGWLWLWPPAISADISRVR